MKILIASLLLASALASPVYAATAKLSQLPSSSVNTATDQLIAVRSGTSVTSNTIATGGQTFTTQSGLGFVTGQPITVVNTVTPANFMQGTVTSYSGTTLVMNAASTGGSGTFTAWTLYGDFQVTPAASAGTDTTNASNITSGTLPAARLPNPSATTLGGMESIATVSHQFLTGLSTSGVPSQAQPAFADISGTAQIAQGGTGVTASQGNGTKVQLSTGTTTTNDCVKFDANGNTVDAGAACGSGSGISSVAATTPDLIVSTASGAVSIGSTSLINPQTGTTYTVLATDIAKTITMTNAGSQAVTLPQAGTTGFEAGKAFCLINFPTTAVPSTSTVTVTPTISKVNGASSVALTSGNGACFNSNGTDYAVFSGAAGGGGSGSVTSVSVVSANGITGTVANATTTPAITLTLGDITPGKVTASKAINSSSVALTISGSAVATDASLGNYFFVTLTNASTTSVSNPSNPVDGEIITYELTQNGSGSNLVTWGSAFDGCASGLPTLSTAAGKVDIVGWKYSARLSKWLLLNGTGLGC